MINWQVQPPLSEPGSGFGQLEVFQFEIVDGVPVVLYCCGYGEFDKERVALHGQNDGIFSFSCNADLSGMDVKQATQFPDTTLYAGRLVKNVEGQWFLLAFRNIVDGEFIGEICDPVPVTAIAGKGIVALS
jgi:beta-fructofuranosidase